MPAVVGRKDNTQLGRLLEETPDLALGGDPVDAEALRRFYARRRYVPVWASRGAQAEDLVATVLRAGDHGLDPDLFRAGLLRRQDELPPLQREVLLTDAFLAYAGALAHGAVPADRRTSFEALAPNEVDVAAVLDEAIDSPDPVSVIDGLAPATLNYLALRLGLRGGGPRNLRGRAALAAVAQQRQRRLSIAANLERERWLPRRLPPDRVWVNVPDQRLVMFRGNEAVFTTAVVVGDNAERNQTPEFTTSIEASFFNPPWVIPRDIVAAEILPRLEREPDYLARNNMVLRANGEIEQSAGPEAGLGFLLFDMPNRFDVYLHDTPDRFLFSRSNRRMSRGCIRVQNPRELASLLLRQPPEEIDRRIATGRTTRARLPAPVPVFITYHTAFVDPEGAMQFRDDFYGRDGAVVQRLRKATAAA
jgi:murein L,D-transpeptidase YcbB/YkuD